MRNTLKIVFFVIMSLGSLSVAAQNQPQVFATCLADSLNGKERKDLAKWIFLAMTVHPSLQEFSNVTATIRESSDQSIGNLVTRLLAEDCPAELRAASAVDPMAIERGFEFVGQVAMQEIMANQETLQALTNYAKYTDQEKITAAMTAPETKDE